MTVTNLKRTFAATIGVLLVATFASAFFIAKKQNRSHNRFVTSAQGVNVVSDPGIFKKVYVISDVHGMYDNLLALLKAAQIVDGNGDWIAANSLLVIAGDSIDKGPQSIEVLSLWVKLQGQARLAQGDLIHTLGNHEAEFLADPADDKKAQALLNEMKSKGLPLTDLTGRTSDRGTFIHDEPVALIVGRWLFSHSGFYPQMSWSDFSIKASDVIARGAYSDPFLIGDDSILEAKDWEKSPDTLQVLLSRLDSLALYGEVFGHQPGAFGIQGRSAAKAEGRLIKIDNGMAPEAGSHPGSVLVFANPKEMNANSYPTVQVILPDGSISPLNPE